MHWVGFGQRLESLLNDFVHCSPPHSVSPNDVIFAPSKYRYTSIDLLCLCFSFFWDINQIPNSMHVVTLFSSSHPYFSNILPFYILQPSHQWRRHTKASRDKKCPGRNSSALAVALAVKSGNNRIKHQDTLIAFADATIDLSMPCHEQQTGAVTTSQGPHLCILPFLLFLLYYWSTASRSSSSYFTVSSLLLHLLRSSPPLLLLYLLPFLLFITSPPSPPSPPPPPFHSILLLPDPHLLLPSSPSFFSSSSTSSSFSFFPSHS